ncbi:tetratricopeptide repeat protein [Arthrobacter sp. alpha11c]
MNNARRRRRRLALWSAPPALLALAVAAKLLSVGALGGYAAQAFETADQDAAAGAASWLHVANLFEPHKAYFASGDVHVLAGDFTAARKDFEAALDAGAGTDECQVRVNLVLSIEKLGDAALAAGNKPMAATLFREALDVLESSPAQCAQEGPGNSSGEGKALDSAMDRLKAKIAADSKGSGEAKKQAKDSPSEPQQEQLQKLGESAQQAQRERTEGQEREEYLRGPENDSSVDRPW